MFKVYIYIRNFHGNKVMHLALIIKTFINNNIEDVISSTVDNSLIVNIPY